MIRDNYLIPGNRQLRQLPSTPALIPSGHVLFLALIFPFLFPNPTHAAACPDKIAQAVSVQGEIEVLSDISGWNRVSLNDALCPGDTLRVGENSRASLVLNDATLMRLDQNTVITFPDTSQGNSSWVKLRNGIAHFIARVRQSFEVVTPFMNAGIEGTEFIVAVTNDTARVTVLEGQVAARNQYGMLTLRPGQSAEAGPGQAPVLKILVRPRDAVQWALHYPAITEIDPDQFERLPTTWQAPLAESFKAYRQGEVAGALQAIATMPEIADTQPGAPPANRNEPDYFPVYLYRAALRLGAGRVAEAQADLAHVLEHDPNNSHALALQAIIAVVQNAKTEGLTLAQQAVQADPRNPAAALALSYARQASFDIPGALDAVEQALVNHKQDALIWARLAELRLAMGQLDESLTAAREAVKLNPDLARTQSVLGFAYLTQIDVDHAKAAFRDAITLDQTDPLPRLGLGLATIRQGDLKQGRREIEIAASLDPNSSLIRSYLGKAYYDERRDGVAATELANAKQLDPFDPTPWFYDAIRKQTDNQPVAALTDLQKSIELNDNRAVYRSRLLLDNDLAARSASLARIYDETGFEQLALSEAYKSVNTDPGDYSAHRFLSDSYASLPRHEIARVSELLQSQLLQPINLNPLQPQLAESNLAILEGSGPSSLAFNEFNPLFTRNRLALQGSALVGGNDTLGNDLVISGVHDKFSYSLGQFHYESDGFRDNNDQELNLYNAFFQLALPSQTSVQFEYRDLQQEAGDLETRFNRSFLPAFRKRDDAQTIRFGLHHVLSPQSGILGSIIYRNQENIQQDSNEFLTTTSDSQTDGYIGELQHQFQNERLTLISGLGTFKTDDIRENSFDFGPLPCLFEGLPPSCIDRGTTKINHDNAYLYSQLNYVNRVNITLGLSADSVELGSATNNQLSPKFGLAWNLSDSTILRSAWFRVLKRDLIADQTLEPTQVAGFNQFFDDENGTDSRRYGIALDHKFIQQPLFAGIEFSHRDLDNPFRDRNTSAPLADARLTEDSHHAYLYWTPRHWLAVSAEYEYERFEFPTEFNRGFIDLKTQRIPLGVRLFFSSGLSAGLKATYIDQKIDLIDSSQENPVVTKGTDQFWVLDTDLNYRLPERHGILTLGIKNLLDEEFSFQDPGLDNPRFTPERLVFGQITLSF